MWWETCEVLESEKVNHSAMILNIYFDFLYFLALNPCRSSLRAISMASGVFSTIITGAVLWFHTIVPWGIGESPKLTKQGTQIVVPGIASSRACESGSPHLRQGMFVSLVIISPGLFRVGWCH